MTNFNHTLTKPVYVALLTGVAGNLFMVITMLLIGNKQAYTAAMTVLFLVIVVTGQILVRQFAKRNFKYLERVFYGWITFMVTGLLSMIFECLRYDFYRNRPFTEQLVTIWGIIAFGVGYSLFSALFTGRKTVNQ